MAIKEEDIFINKHILDKLYEFSYISRVNRFIYNEKYCKIEYETYYKLFKIIERKYYENITLLRLLNLKDMYNNLDSVKINNRLMIETVLDLINLRYYGNDYEEIIKKLSNVYYDQNKINKICKYANLNPNIININTKIELSCRLSHIYILDNHNMDYIDIVRKISGNIKRYNNYAHPNIFYDDNIRIDNDIVYIMYDMLDCYNLALCLMTQYIVLNNYNDDTEYIIRMLFDLHDSYNYIYEYLNSILYKYEFKTDLFYIKRR